MSAQARIASRFQSGVAAITAVLCCSLASGAQAQPYDFSALAFELEGISAAALLHPPAPSFDPKGLEITGVLPDLEDRMLASRPSPYVKTSSSSAFSSYALPKLMPAAGARPVMPAFALNGPLEWYPPLKATSVTVSAVTLAKADSDRQTARAPAVTPPPELQAADAAAYAPNPYIMKAGRVDMASALVVAQQSTLIAANAASAEASGMQVAANVAPAAAPRAAATLNLAAQASEPVPGGPLWTAPGYHAQPVASVQPSPQVMAANDAKTLGALAPAAGTLTLPDMQPVPGGAAMPMPSLAPLPSSPAAASPLVPMPAVTAPEAISEMPQLHDLPQTHLSEQSKAIADRLPPEKPKKIRAKAPVKVEHFQKSPLENEEVREHQGIGISISVRKPGANINHQLEEAYEALISGDQEDAILLYKQVLAEQPDNKLALFGLATTYHRIGQLQLARPLYGRLLAIDPNNAEGLNNFLVLLGDESPTEALQEMRKLEATHPDFSPLPAQMAVIYDKTGDYVDAIESMKHAIDISPENIKYRYDMAVMLDREGDWEDAAVYYQQLITAEERGDKIPAKPEEIQERLTFIRSNRPKS